MIKTAPDIYPLDIRGCFYFFCIITHKNYKRLGIKMAINKESVALNVINESFKLPFVKVDRSDFLTKTFSNKIDDMPKLFKEG